MATIYRGSRLRVVVSGGVARGASPTTIRIARGAFGSGEHETTASCLGALEALPGLDRARVLDLGSGTGILAIAAVVLGAREAVCVDVDLAAVRTARRNCAANGVGGAVRHVLGTLAAVGGPPFDLALANLYGDVLLAEASRLVAALRPGARLLLSGVLWEDRVAVRDRYRELGCRVVRERMLDEYTTTLMVLDGAS